MKMTRLTYEILDTIGTGAMIWLLLGHPTKGVQRVRRYLTAKQRQKQYRLRKRLKFMQKEGLIIILGGEAIEMTERGKVLLERMHHENITPQKQKWDGIWRLVSYDIPNTMRVQRDALRQKFKDWGFEQIQESVWVFPYECKEEMALIAQDYGIGPYVLYMTANTLPMSSKLIKQFNL